MTITERTSCRVCGASSLYQYLDLGNQPFANDLRPMSDPTGIMRAPLRLLACLDCGLSQLSHVVAPEILYSHYAYFSGVSLPWHTHCAGLLDDFDPLEGKFIVDVASNDGTLLKEAERRGAKVLGVEPASDFLTCGYPMLQGYWGTKLVRNAVTLQGQVDVLTTMNVLGHMDDVHDFMDAVVLALKPSGIAIIEAPYILDLLHNNAFDTVYHEHLSYWGLKPILRLLADHDLVLHDVTPLRVHGGSMRYRIAKHGLQSNNVLMQLRRESVGTGRYHYDGFGERVQTLLREIDHELAKCDCIFGAAAKATVLLNAIDDKHFTVAYDDTPSKQNKFIPGTSIQVRAPSRSAFKKHEAMALLAWNWQAALAARARDLGFTGRFFVPLPKPRWFA